MLNIQQSGIYLNASLLSALNNTDLTASQQKPSLTGILTNQQLSLSKKSSSLAPLSYPRS
jgi:hypothetical protein